MDSNELRQKFVQYFKEKGHVEVPSASLIPENDPSVLFTTAGMQQFKRYYTNPQEAPSKNVVTVQPCIRTSDIDEVGDETHLTFFEMLGNFSFGGYFKKEAIEYAWEFLTQVLNIDKSRISATYFGGGDGISEDNESKEILNSIDGLEKIEPQDKDNFWSLGTENSPGGPTVEFYVDGVEVWNLVFNQYLYRNGKYQKSEFNGVDTGMGLERLLVVLNKVENVYQTDLFAGLIEKISQLSGKKYKENARDFSILADHIKASVFILSSGIEPSNIGQGYIIRRLIRRSIRKYRVLGIQKNPIEELLDVIISIYPNKAQILNNQKQKIIDQYNKEYIKFEKSLNWVEQYKIDLEAAVNNGVIKKIKDAPIITDSKTASGRYVYENYQTYGVPPDLSQEIINELGLKFNEQEYNEAIKQHQDLSRTASVGMFKGGLASGGEMETKYHTATHLLLAALRKVLGEEVIQRGSNINAERLRFDFSYPDKLTQEQIEQVENLVNKKIQEDLPVDMQEMNLEDAQNCGAMGVFEHKYGDKVKVYTITEFSKEICGGPHVTHTGILGHLCIIT